MLDVGRFTPSHVMPRSPATPGAKRQPAPVSKAAATNPAETTATCGTSTASSVAVITLQPDAHGAPMCASVVLWAVSGRFTAALMHEVRIPRLLADLDEFGETFVANHLFACSPHAHWFLFPVQGTGSNAAEAAANLRARIDAMLTSRARTERGQMELLAASFADTSWSEALSA
jgi:hypothetical protein